MLIKVEPAGFFMHTVQLIFDVESPDAEDRPVRDYLADNELEPHYQSTGEYEGRQCEIMQFGGCYLGRHLQSVGQIQRRAVEVELLTAAVESHLAALAGELKLEPELPVTKPRKAPDEERRRETLAALATNLVADLYQESAFQANESGELVASLSREEVRAAAQRRLKA